MRGAWCLCVVVALAGCAGATLEEQGRGNIQVFVEGEPVIQEGLDPGDQGHSMQDGYSVRYSRFLAVVGNFRASRSSHPQEVLREPSVYVVDLRGVATGGFVFAELRDVPAARFDKVGFDLPNAGPSTLREPGTSAEDHAFMVEHGYSIYIDATLTKSGAQTRIRWGLAAGTSFDDCAPEDGAAGFAVPTGGTVQVKPTIHGDHWFFTNITQGAETTQRRAQWIADADRDGDGATTLEELRQTPAAEVFPPAQYNLSGAITPIETAYDYVLNQTRTLGDFQGHGECPTRAVLP